MTARGALRIVRSGPLRGRARVAGDLHIGQQALVWAALGSGTSSLRGLAARTDHALLLDALRAFGVSVVQADEHIHVQGVGVTGLSLPRGALSAGDSVTTLELLVALLAGQHFGTRVEATGTARTHALQTLIVPLRERGAHVSGTRDGEGELSAPVAVAPLLEDERLEPAEIAIPSGDPATKLGLLISGLYARGVTAIDERMLSRDHVERALVALGAPVHTAGGMTLLDTTEGVPAWPGFVWDIPGDFTLAAFLLAAVLSVPGSDVRIEDVGLNPTRTAFLAALNGTGARVAVTPRGDAAGNEPIGNLRAQHGLLRAIRIGGEGAFRMLDELPAIAALAAVCRGRLSLRDVGALRMRRPDALKATIGVLAQFGIAATVYDDGFELDPPGPLTAAHIAADVPPGQALLGCILGLSTDGETRIEGASRLDALYPGFIDTLVALGAPIVREETP